MHHNVGKRGGKSRLFRWGRAKFAKAQRVPLSAQIRSDTVSARSDCWLVSAESALLSFGQVEGLRRVLIRQLRRLANCNGRLLLRVFPRTPRSRRKVGLRMGGAKSPFSSLFYRLYAGSVICELRGLAPVFAAAALAVVSRRLPGRVFIRWR